MSKKLGKIDNDLFEAFIQAKCGAERQEVSVGPQFGVDVSLVDLPNNMVMASTSDPLSLVPSLGLEESAWLSVHLLANDMATTGFAPMYGQFVLNLPAKFSASDFKIYWEYMHKFCKSIGTAITGGHTGFIEGQNSTIAGGGTLMSIVPKNEVLVSKNASVGDVILVTKSAAMSASAILARSFPDTVANNCGEEVSKKAGELFFKTSSLQDALVATQVKGQVTAMHDVTEGGILGAIYEMAMASGNGALVCNEALPIGDIQRAVCNIFSIDPRYSLGTGSMIIACKKGTQTVIIDRLQKAGIACAEVGEIKPQTYGIKLEESNTEKNIVYSKEDPYWAAYFKALNQQWK